MNSSWCSLTTGSDINRRNADKCGKQRLLMRIAIAAGEAAWDKAGCPQCHGASGEGGTGGEFPAGPSLRTTKLDRAALRETISCGLPATEMPAWLDGAYTQRPCYSFPVGPPPAGTTLTPVLDANEIDALVDYLTATIVGK